LRVKIFLITVGLLGRHDGIALGTDARSQTEQERDCNKSEDESWRVRHGANNINSDGNRQGWKLQFQPPKAKPNFTVGELGSLWPEGCVVRAQTEAVNPIREITRNNKRLIGVVSWIVVQVLTTC
jgi:hypothetical protein